MRILLGLAIVFGSVFGGFIMATGKLASFWQPAEYVIILGAGLGALVIGNSKVVLKEIMHQVKAVFAGKKNEAEQTEEILTIMFIFLSLINKEGIKVLDDHVDEPENSPIFKQYPNVMAEPLLLDFITDNLRTLSMNSSAPPHEVEAMLDSEILTIEEDLEKPSKALHSVAEAMPGFGILAAVGGIVITMGYLDGSIATIGMKVAAALIGTFIGIFACYCILGPISNAMHGHVERQISQLHGIKVILIKYLEKNSPIMCVDAGRRVVELDIKPSFAVLDGWIREKKDDIKKFASKGGS